MNKIFLQYGPRDFKEVAKMDRKSSERLVEMISDDPIIQSDNRKKQSSSLDPVDGGSDKIKAMGHLSVVLA